MKDLPPSQRPKTRYIRFKIHSRNEVSIGDAVEAIWEFSTGFMGINGMTRSDMWIMGEEYSSGSNEGVIRVNREVLNEFISSLLFIEEINSEECFVEVKNISGSLKKV